jgi:hypothetical protein
MNNNESRLMATFLVWLAFTVIMVAAMVTGALVNSGAFFLIGFIILVVAVGTSTQAIWKYGSGADSGEMAEKAKRRSKVDRILDRMDESQLDELRARLLDEPDGEAVSLNELLAERERRRSR